MKRCPTCHRAETDETLKFCRDDGALLVSDSSVGNDYSATRILPASQTGDAQALQTETGQAAGTTSALDARGDSTTQPGALNTQGTSGGARELSKPKSRRVIVTAAVPIIIVAVAASAYFYMSRVKDSTGKSSIAVLPFVNANGDPNTEYLSDGITESLINSLSQLPNLAVKARSTVFRYKGRDADPQQIGSELHVQAVLSGRMTQRGDDLILSLELVDAKTGDQIWGEQYNRKTADLVALQQEIARDVTSKLRTKLSGADDQKLAKSYTSNTEAYQLYLRGRFYWNKRTPQDLQKSIEYFQQAIAVDPNYALAYAGLGDAYALLSIYGGAPPREAMPKAKEAVLKALSLDDNLAEAYAGLGLILDTYDYDFAGAEHNLKRAIELNPNYAPAHQFYGDLLTYLGRHEEAFAEFRRALEIDPFSPVINRFYGESFLFARKYDAAITQLKRTIELDADFPSAHKSLSAAYWLKGNHAEAIEELATYQELRGEQKNGAMIRESFAKGGIKAFLLTMTGESRLSNSSPYFLAIWQAALGEKDKAFAELNKAYENRDSDLELLKVDPRLDPLRDDPRFAELVHRVRLP